jgi:hypothetical protein
VKAVKTSAAPIRTLRKKTSRATGTIVVGKRVPIKRGKR